MQKATSKLWLLLSLACISSSVAVERYSLWSEPAAYRSQRSVLMRNNMWKYVRGEVQLLTWLADKVQVLPAWAIHPLVARSHIHAPTGAGILVGHGMMGPLAEYHGIARHPEPGSTCHVSTKQKMLLLMFFTTSTTWKQTCKKTTGCLRVWRAVCKASTCVCKEIANTVQGQAVTDSRAFCKNANKLLIYSAYGKIRSSLMTPS